MKKLNDVNLKRNVSRLMFISGMLTTLVVVFVASAPTVGVRRRAHVDEHWWKIMTSDWDYWAALVNHDIDVGIVRYVEDVRWLESLGYTITSTTRIGYTFTIENNRVWPFGTEHGGPTDPEYWRTVNFRKAIHRLIPKDEYVALWAPYMSKAEWWLPPGQAYWINPDCPLPTFDPMTANALLDEAGFVQGTALNPWYDPELEWSAQHTRIDPLTGEDLTFEFYVVSTVECPWMAPLLINDYLHTAGIRSDLVWGTWLGFLLRLLNDNLYDYQLMMGIGLAWGSTAPDILYDFTYHQNLPLWNFAGMNISELNEADKRMMSALDLAECRQAAFDIQTYLSYYEPYCPLMLWNAFTAETGPYDTQPGAIGIVNFEGRGVAASGNVWGKMLGRADRHDPSNPDVEINKWGLWEYLDSLNPLTAESDASWQILNTVEDYLFKRNPYTLDYMWWAAEDEPTIEEWIGPGRSQIEGNKEYDNPFNGTHYLSVGLNGIDETSPCPLQGPYPPLGGDDYWKPVVDVTAEDLAGDDQLGMVTTWTLRPDIYWHDSDPGSDMTFGTEDDGVVYPVTAEDARFFFDLIRFQENVKYSSTWNFIHCVEVMDQWTFKVLEERRYLFAFESHNVALVTPQHIWEPFIQPTVNVDACQCLLPDGNGTFGNIWTGWEKHHVEWLGWNEPYISSLLHPDETLTHLIGCGPFYYPLDGWNPGISVYVKSNTAYFGRCVCPGDIDFDQKVEEDDLHTIMASFGTYEDPNYDAKADICYPAQIITLDEVYAVQYDYFGCWWGPGPVPPGWKEYTG